jgi:hypothetical protein
MTRSSCKHIYIYDVSHCDCPLYLRHSVSEIHAEAEEEFDDRSVTVMHE